MTDIECDVAVVGAGTAGIAAHRAALDAGVRSILVEQGPGGTTCARVGCMPSKLLIAAATAAYDARDAHRFGIRVDGVGVDGPAVMQRVRTLRDRFVGSVREGLEALPKDSRIDGRATFVDRATLTVDDHTRVRFKAAVLATGSSPNIPKPLQPVAEHILTTDTVFEIEDLPGSIAVLGAGPIGLELAQAFSRLGVDVVLFDHSEHLSPLKDKELRAAAERIFAEEIEFVLGSTVEGASRSDGGLTVRWSDRDGQSRSRRFDSVLAAAGRPPNVRGIGLEQTGLHLDDKGSPAFDPRSLRCEGAPVFIAGDANQDRPVLHEASRQGRIAGRNAAALAAGREIERPERWVDLAMVFTHPQMAVIGTADPGKAPLVGKIDFRDQGRAQVMGRNQGGLCLYADTTGRLIGAEMVGPDVEHLAHLLAYAVQDGLTAKSLRDRPFYHPTVEEGLDGALSEIEKQIER